MSDLLSGDPGGLALPVVTCPSYLREQDGVSQLGLSAIVMSFDAGQGKSWAFHAGVLAR